MQYSIQLYTVRHAMERDVTGTIERLAGIGYTAVEPYNFVSLADELGTALSKTGLSAPSGHAPLLREEQAPIFDAARRLGMTTVIDPHVDATKWQSVDDIAETASRLNSAATAGAEYGIRVGYHNHNFELESRIDGKTGLEHLAGRLDPEVVLEVDTYWAAAGGEDPVALLKRLGDRVRFIHIKDGPMTLEPSDQVAVGAGRMPIWDVIDAAPSLEVGVVELDDFRGDMFTAVADSLAYLENGRGGAAGGRA